MSLNNKKLVEYTSRLQQAVNTIMSPGMQRNYIQRRNRGRCSLNDFHTSPASGITLGVVTQVPNGGFGIGKYKKITFTDGGAYQIVSDDEIAVTFPRIGGFD